MGRKRSLVFGVGISDWVGNVRVGLSGWALDKDILQKGNKLYSKDACCFVPQELNSLLTKSDNSRGEYPVGVYFHKTKGKFVAMLINCDSVFAE